MQAWWERRQSDWKEQTVSTESDSAIDCLLFPRVLLAPSPRARAIRCMIIKCTQQVSSRNHPVIPSSMIPTISGFTVFRFPATTRSVARGTSYVYIPPLRRAESEALNAAPLPGPSSQCTSRVTRVDSCITTRSFDVPTRTDRVGHPGSTGS